MFCPKCAAQNIDGAKYCRACGADISLVPQAMTGQLAERLSADGMESKGRHRRRETPSVDGAVRQFFMGVGFVAVALALSVTRMGMHWWFWMLIPAFIFIGGGIGSYLRVREEQKRLAPPAFVPAQAALPMSPGATTLPPRRNTGELVQPPSVTEATTRHLAMPAEHPPKDV